MSDFTVHVSGAKEAAATLRRFQATRALVSFADGLMPRLALGLRQWAPFREHSEDFSESAPSARHLRDSILVVRHTSTEAVQILATSDVPQARFTIEGTKPHVIEPVAVSGRTPRTPWRPASGGARSVLHWISAGGQDVFATRVNHPGTRPNEWPRHFMDTLLPGLPGELARAVERELST
jgi:hypothetical protein